MKDTKYLEIIKAPVITEKSMANTANNVYTFERKWKIYIQS